MPRKKSPYMVIETQEDFHHWFDEIFKNWKKQGFQEGKELTLAYFLDLINEKFDDETVRNASFIANNIAKERVMSKFKKKEGDTNGSDSAREGGTV